MIARMLSRMHCVMRWMLRAAVSASGPTANPKNARGIRSACFRRLDIGAARCINDGHNNIREDRS